MVGDLEDLARLGEDAYLWGLYPVVTYETRYIFTQAQSVGVNRLAFHQDLAGPDDRRVVTPNATTLYGTGFIDLTDEPFVIELPALDWRYYSLQVMDHYGDYFLEAGEPFTGTQARRFVLCGPSWTGSLPPQVNMREIVAAPSNTVWAILRVAVTENTEIDLKVARDFFAGMRAMPLQLWLTDNVEAPAIRGAYPIHPRMPELTSLFRDATAADFFEILSLCLSDPTYTKRLDSVTERDLLTRLATVGLDGRQPFTFADLYEPIRQGLSEGYTAGKQKVASAFRTSFIRMSGGWALGSNWGCFGTDFLRRAVAAGFGWGGAGPHSHTAAFLFTDADGAPLDGSTGQYTMTFDINNLPPVRNHWEIPIYDADGYFVANEINRYSLNSYLLDRGELVATDRQLSICIQHDKPDNPDQRKNWLPAPAGPFRFAARFYGPDAPLIDGSYPMPPVVPSR